MGLMEKLLGSRTRATAYEVQPNIVMAPTAMYGWGEMSPIVAAPIVSVDPLMAPPVGQILPPPRNVVNGLPPVQLQRGVGGTQQNNGAKGGGC